MCKVRISFPIIKKIHNYLGILVSHVTYTILMPFIAFYHPILVRREAWADFACSLVLPNCTREEEPLKNTVCHALK